MGSRTAGLLGPDVWPRDTPLSDAVRVTVRRPFVTANAPEDRMVPGIAPPVRSNPGASVPLGLDALDGRLSPAEL